MAQNSKIEWTHHTANLWHGCTKVHEGCDNCYAEALAKRWGNDVWGNDKPRKEIKSVWNELAKMQDAAKKAGEKHRVFVGSMMDIFEKPMPLIDSKGVALSEDTGALRFKLFRFIEAGNYPNLIFLLLTKRPSNINKYIPESWKETPPENVMFGTSPVNQETANKLIVQIAKVKGKRFISIEPQLAEIDLMQPAIDGDIANGLLLDWVDWVIVGGESGHGKRPFNLDWARKIKEDCNGKNVPFFFKQIDKVRDKTEGIPADLQERNFPTETVSSAFC
jgi:protein gp37